MPHTCAAGAHDECEYSEDDEPDTTNAQAAALATSVADSMQHIVGNRAMAVGAAGTGAGADAAQSHEDAAGAAPAPATTTTTATATAVVATSEAGDTLAPAPAPVVLPVTAVELPAGGSVAGGGTAVGKEDVGGDDDDEAVGELLRDLTWTFVITREARQSWASLPSTLRYMALVVLGWCQVTDAFICLELAFVLLQYFDDKLIL